MTSSEIRQKFLEFFEKRGHKIIPSSSLIPENDPSVLFNIAGMQPLMPYLLGKKHPQGKRLVNIQKCIPKVRVRIPACFVCDQVVRMSFCNLFYI